MSKQDSEADANQMVIEEDDHDESESLDAVPKGDDGPKAEETATEPVEEQPKSDQVEAEPTATNEISLEDFIKTEKKSLADRI